jgi:soluble lytic murein transglycosylase-like protein
MAKTVAMVFVFAALGSAGICRAEPTVYAYADERGVLHLSNVPDDARYRPLAGPEPVSQAPAATSTKAQPATPRRYQALIDGAAQAYGVDAALVHAVISVESGYNARAVSRRGATGLMQLMGPTAARYGVSDLFDPSQNVRAGTQHLRDLLLLFGNDLELTLAAYNAGVHAVERHGRKIPPYPETLAYVPRVLRLYVRASLAQ